MLHPPKFPPNHPSFIQLEENDDVVAKYKERILSVCDILTSDQKNQTMLLKKILDVKSMSSSLTASNAVSLL